MLDRKLFSGTLIANCGLFSGGLMKVLITVWNGRVSPVFDVAKDALLVEIEEKKVLSQKTVTLGSGCNMDKVSVLLKERIDVLVCGAVSRRVEVDLMEKGVFVYSFISGETGEIINALLENRLSAMNFAMPGCRLGRKMGKYKKRRVFNNDN